MGDITACDQTYGPGAGWMDRYVGDNPYPYAECTWYCWQWYRDLHGLTLPPDLGNGGEWADNARWRGWAVSDMPTPGTVVSWGAERYPPFGHVAIVTGMTTDGFMVAEMNFTWYAARNPAYAGRVDCRAVSGKGGGGVRGFLLPAGAPAGANATLTGSVSGGSIMDALDAPIRAIATSIADAGLMLEAEVQTARMKAIAVAQAGGGMAVMSAGAGLAALTALGRGRPSAGATLIGRRARQAARMARRPTSPITTPLRQTGAERLWAPTPKP